MSPTATDNVAGRLHAILEAARKLNKREQARKVWGGILKTDEPGLLLRRLARVIEMPERLEVELRLALEDRPEDLPLHMEWRKPVYALFSSLNLEAIWEGSVGHITDPALLSLRHCAALLHWSRPEPALKGDQLDKLRTDVQAAIDEAKSADISEHTRRTVVEHLTAVLDALDEAEVFGSAPLAHAAEATFGAVLFARYHTSERRDWAILWKAVSVTYRALYWLGFSVNTLQLPEKITGLDLPEKVASLFSLEAVADPESSKAPVVTPSER